MPLTAEDIASLQPLTEEERAAITDRPSWLSRLGSHTLNAPSDIFNDLTRSFYNLGFGLKGSGPVEVPQVTDIPEAQTSGEKLVDAGAMLARSVPMFMTGEGAGTAVGNVIGAGKVATGMLKMAGGFALPGLGESVEHGVAGAGLGAASEAASYLPAKYRMPLAAAVSAASALGEYDRSGDTTNAAIAGAMGVPFLFGRRGVKPPPAEEDLSGVLRDRPRGPELDYVQTARPATDPYEGMSRITRPRLGEGDIIEAERIVPEPPNVAPMENLLRAPRGVDFETQGQPFPTRTPALEAPSSIINPVEFSKDRTFTMVPDSNGVYHVPMVEPRLPLALPEPAPIATLQPELGNHIVGPAIVDDTGKVLISGKIGENHQSLMAKAMGTPDEEAVVNAFIDDANHVFLTDTGAKLDRQAGAKFAVEKGQAPEGTENLHSQTLASHAEEQRKLMESDPNARPPTAPTPPVPPVAPKAPRPPKPPRPPEPAIQRAMVAANNKQAPQVFRGYHGTRSDFENISTETPDVHRKSDPKFLYFSGDKDTARQYTSRGSGKRRIIEADVTLRNPLDITPIIEKEIAKGKSFGDAKRTALKQLTDAHDGFVFRGNEMNPPEYAVRSPEQVVPIPKKPVATLQSKEPSKLKASVGVADESGRVPVKIEGKEYAIVKHDGKWHDANTYDPDQPTASLLASNKQEAVRALKRAHSSQPLSLEREAAAAVPDVEVTKPTGIQGEATMRMPGESWGVGEKVLVNMGFGDEPAKVISSEGGKTTVRTKDGSEITKFDDQLKPIATRAADATAAKGNLESAGDLRDLEKLEKQNRQKGTGMKRRMDVGEAGAIPADLAVDLGRYVAAPLTGAAIGAVMSDEDHRIAGAVKGALIVGAVSVFGPKIARLLAESSPSVHKPTSVASGIKQATSIAKEFGKAITGDEKMASRAAAEGMHASGFERLARWTEKHIGTLFPEGIRIHDKAQGEVDVLMKTFHMAMRSLVSQKDALVDPRIRSAFDDYFHGKISASAFAARVRNKELSDLGFTLKSTSLKAQEIIADGLHDTALRNKVKQNIQNNTYLTTAYRIFNDPKYMPTDRQIEAAAKTMDAKFGSVERRMEILHQYLHEIKANQKLYRTGRGEGENLASIASKKDLTLSPEFRDMLGIYTDPIEMMAATGAKLINGARTANFFDEVANHIRKDGTKLVYTSAEKDAVLQSLTHRRNVAAAAGNKDLVATLQSQIDLIGEYVWNAPNPVLGKLSGVFIHRRMRDALSTFDSVNTQMPGAIGQAIAQSAAAIRYGKIVLSPLQMMRQVVGVPLLGLMAGTGPQHWAEAFKALRDPATRARLERLGVASGDQIAGMFRKDSDAILRGKIKSVIGEHANAALNKWEEAFRTPDLTVRASAFLKKEREMLDAGKTATEAENIAIDHMNRYTMNYGAVPQGVKLGRQLPFINQYMTFAYEAARIAKNIGEDAFIHKDVGAMAKLITMATYPLLVQKAFEASLSESDRKEWQQMQAMQPDYMRGNFNIVTGKDKNGNWHWWNFTPLVVHDWMMKMGKDIMAGDGAAMMADNPIFGWDNTPLVNVLFSQAGGKDMHTKQTLDTIGKRFDSFRREVAPPLLGTDLDRWNDALTPNEEGGLGIRDMRTGRDVNWESMLASYLTSIRGYSQNLDFSKRMKVSQAKAQISEIHNDLRRVLQTNARQSSKDEAIKRAQIRQKQVLMDLRETIGEADLSRD